MGSATESNAKPQIPMAEADKKTFKKFLMFFKKDKKKEKPVETSLHIPEVPVKLTSVSAQAVENVLQKIQKLKIKEQVEDTEDEFANFSFKTVDDECRNDRSNSHSSEDSGFEEKGTDGDDDKRDDEVIVALEKLNLKEDKHQETAKIETKDTETHTEIDRETNNVANKKTDTHENKLDKEQQSDDKDEDDKENKSDKCAKGKKTQQIVVARAPIRHQLVDYKTQPYSIQTKDPCRQIQINKHTLTGGAVIVNRSTDFLEVDAALKQVQRSSEHSQHENQDEWLSIITEYIQGDSSQGKPPQPQDTIPDRSKDHVGTTVEDFLSDFFESSEMQQDFYQRPVESDQEPLVMTPRQSPDQYFQHRTPEIQIPQPQAPMTEYSQNYELLGELDLSSLNAFVEAPSYKSPNPQFIFPTPPHSENAASPMSDSQGSFRNSEYVYSPGHSLILSSPERSSPVYNSDYEKFQEITHFEEPSSIPLDAEKKTRERNNSTSSMTMKQYKDLQKEISHSFSKYDCCQMTRKSCKQQFQEHLQKLAIEERKSICLKVTKMELKYAYGVLLNVLRSLSQSSELEDLNHALFCLVCERVLAQMPAWYVDDFGLNLLKSAALRCPDRPLLTRYLVQCVRAAIRIDPSAVQGKESVFHEVDAQGDTLVTACARRGDACADVLAELVRREPDDLPLFRVHHLNTDGASALHVACCEHGAGAPRLRVVHALLDHAGADLWQGDAKAGDTPVHMAVNAKNCDLRLIMVLFKHVDRKLWKKLAHAPNLCSTTPLEYARSATKSQVRDGYPTEVLEFLKKCR